MATCNECTKIKSCSDERSLTIRLREIVFVRSLIWHKEPKYYVQGAEFNASHDFSL